MLPSNGGVNINIEHPIGVENKKQSNYMNIMYYLYRIFKMKKYVILFLLAVLSAVDGFCASMAENQYVPIPERTAQAAYRVWTASNHNKSAQFSRDFESRLQTYAEHSLGSFLDKTTHISPKYVLDKGMDLTLKDRVCWGRVNAILRDVLPVDQRRSSGNKVLLMIALDPLVEYALNAKNQSFETFFTRVESFIASHQAESLTEKIVALAINIEKFKKNLPQ